jgi:TM2 domain-containing membrane protein YozV
MGAPVPKVREANAIRGPRPRRRLLFAFLAVVAGFLGAHNFYARQWLTGLLQLFLSVATFLMGFGIIASWIWAMTEAVFIRRDGDGVEMI